MDCVATRNLVNACKLLGVGQEENVDEGERDGGPKDVLETTLSSELGWLDRGKDLPCSDRDGGPGWMPSYVCGRSSAVLVSVVQVTAPRR